MLSPLVPPTLHGSLLPQGWLGAVSACCPLHQTELQPPAARLGLSSHNSQALPHPGHSQVGQGTARLRRWQWQQVTTFSIQPQLLHPPLSFQNSLRSGRFSFSSGNCRVPGFFSSLPRVKFRFRGCIPPCSPLTAPT